MPKGTFHYKYKIISDLDSTSAFSILDLVLNKPSSFIDVFKDDKKCFVAKFKTNISSGCFVIKVPRARLSRYWERFQTWFRAGESFRQFDNFKKLRTLGFKAPAPLLAAEKRRWGMVVDSFMIYTYIDGRLATSDDVDKIAPELIKLLNRGFTRKDPHPQNFIIAQDEVYFIDFNIKRPLLFNKLRCCMEYCKFLETVPDGSRYINQITNSTALFSLANILQKCISCFRRTRRRISKKLK